MFRPQTQHGGLPGLPLSQVLRRTGLDRKQLLSLIGKGKFPPSNNGFWSEDAIQDWLLGVLEERARPNRVRK